MNVEKTEAAKKLVSKDEAVESAKKALDTSVDRRSKLTVRTGLKAGSVVSAAG